MAEAGEETASGEAWWGGAIGAATSRLPAPVSICTHWLPTACVNLLRLRQRHQKPPTLPQSRMHREACAGCTPAVALAFLGGPGRLLLLLLL